jgi:ABC-type uncharacterized transport system involved in gliding motility auxiliary subunit
MKEMSKAAGFVGLVAVILGGNLWVLQPRFSPWVIALLAAGGVLILLFLALNFGMVIAALGKRATLYGINLVVATLAMLAILVLIQIIVMRNNVLNHRFDLTEAKLYSISDQSIKILKSLQKDVRVTAFYQEPDDKGRMEDLLRIYSRYSPRFTYELLDLDRAPERAKEFNIKSYNTGVVQCGEKREELPLSQQEEGPLTNALIKVTRETDKVIYFTSGHGEKNIQESGRDGASGLKEAIEKAAYKVKDIVIARERGGIPAECSALVVMGPQVDFYPFELEQLDRYLQEGGRVLFMLDPETVPGLVTFLDQYGVIVDNDYVIDPNPLSQFLGGNSLSPLVTEYSRTHEITKGFNIACLLPVARSVRIKENLGAGIKGEWIARASDESWGETNFALLKQARQARFDRGSDIPGPVPLALAVTMDAGEQKPAEASEQEEQPEETGSQHESQKKETQKNQARLVVIGDSDMGGAAPQDANKNFLLNAVSWLVEERDLISIMPKQRKNAPMIVSRADQRVLFFVPLVGLAECVVLAGGLVYLNRRKYR